MENGVDFIELAKYCEEKKRDGFGSEYRGTLYAAISADDSMTVSETPHILKGAKKCIIIHIIKSNKGDDRCSVQVLNCNGVVPPNADLDDGFQIGISDQASNYYRPGMFIDYKEERLFYTEYDFSGGNWRNWGKILPDIWNLYLKLKNECTNVHEMEMLCNIVKRDNKIIDLSRKLDQEKYKNLQKDIQIKAYKTLLDEIRELVEKNHQ